MRLKHIENLSGNGEIHDQSGDFVARCRYRLRLYKALIDVAPTHGEGRQTIPGGFETKGTITPEISRDARTPWFIDKISKPLVLHLSERRRLDFLFSDTNGTINANGGIYDG